ncbi:hypothetical protein C1922_04375 [Stenotrophomonas sp. ZAC14D2_NAIMI4_7]|nr:hypothetical protein C1922_04375 [Stenotrophomonas sp. ZAC14D2_NAIMI4_7]AWH28196.1 hypothetical protein C1931_04185 [Stenotrophomonas sp. YAU14A_MKIMI4_1]AWH32134.1 hypothetical protein C1930_04220 [Stenotrophomonas sp. SAU14A_NAIMI4_8]
MSTFECTDIRFRENLLSPGNGPGPFLRQANGLPLQPRSRRARRGSIRQKSPTCAGLFGFFCLGKPECLP